MPSKTNAPKRKKPAPETETWKCETLTDGRRIFQSEWRKSEADVPFQTTLDEAGFVEYCDKMGFDRAFTKQLDGSFVVVLTPKKKKQLAINF